ncbi:hypothetical protein QBC33DRAFT_539451 [Phialemonium atrogriseum]|uniref:Uncharacterized protein n=1 Tax=Phialemonium atrogriseum TaxID=1093897 RepID=A0AAJ0FNI0_9PEZI|nr:uncharacterized protein QBC33DRAFT_539451 [Phialemonium atrogriseum]KAK1767175.1 hypothetical protein QBC33DRAFT_539451 [Phialemonium atrogriseum]
MYSLSSLLSSFPLLTLPVSFFSTLLLRMTPKHPSTLKLGSLCTFRWDRLRRRSAFISISACPSNAQPFVAISPNHSRGEGVEWNIQVLMAFQLDRDTTRQSQSQEEE